MAWLEKKEEESNEDRLSYVPLPLEFALIEKNGDRKRLKESWGKSFDFLQIPKVKITYFCNHWESSTLDTIQEC